MISVDLGANSGRVAVGRFDGKRVTVTEVKRFPNVPVQVNGRLYWDALRLYDGILEGLRAAARDGQGPVASVAVDGWGVDFALLDRAGHLLGNPVHYRDRRTEKAFSEVCEKVPPKELFAATGVQLMAINTVHQLWSMRAARDPALDAAAAMVMVPDLVNFWLSGQVAQEWTEASTTQCYDLARGDWAWGVLDRLELPKQLFGQVKPSGTVLGALRPEVVDASGLPGTSVIAGASHDTAAAIAAIPFEAPGAIYVSSGTWSVLGTEVPAPIVDDSAFAANLTNEGGPYGTVQLMSNLTGLWLLQECVRSWSLSGQDFTLPELLALAGAAPPLRSLVDPNAATFAAPGDMPARIAGACHASGQEVPQSAGEVVRCILESLALAYRQTAELVARVSSRPATAVHVVGGGSLNELLCQWTADATGLPVLAGPSEASELGNLLVQAVALGELASADDARSVARASFPPVLYEPRARDRWDEASERFRQLNAAGQHG
ncbi:MAG TPA: rhamnulokinase family protein [Acidimicrobiales bacterium]|nr:rhamnulokinase family protein [Acidimicrobiales bacterium]